jgi:hypothetical protein
MQVGPTDDFLHGWRSYLGRHRDGTLMATFITIGYGDRAGYDRTDPLIRAEAHRHDADLVERGVTMGTAGTATQVRNHDDAEVVAAEARTYGPSSRSPGSRSSRPTAWTRPSPSCPRPRVPSPRA